ncbi:RWD domain-containing protein 4-like [Centruroides vittatus]|uniref:RWD domain-containing protein 4-like n=2 Tax=Centruroides sculpturatus TaxID=218467 RepID=UPI000C6ED1A4|nr:RWD domain-containing protein 4-like [Centruroides sculpturatus]
MTNKELQIEELEVLESIYDGDENFRKVSDNKFQYKVKNEDDSKSFLLEIIWNENYPSEIPIINLDAFYNKHLLPEVKNLIISRLNKEANMLLDTAMTYTLFEFAKENIQEFTDMQPDNLLPNVNGNEELTVDKTPEPQISSKKEKKPKLTKQQKRKLANRVNTDGELPRGWNWVDVVKHLSQIGSGPKVSSSQATNS